MNGEFNSDWLSTWGRTYATKGLSAQDTLGKLVRQAPNADEVNSNLNLVPNGTTGFQVA